MEAVAFLVFLLIIVFLLRVGGRSSPAPHRPTHKATSIKTPSRQAQNTVVPYDRESATPAPQQRLIEGPARIVDGDTIVIRKHQIRLFGIDAPELNHPYGKKAKWALVSLCKGRRVRAEILETDAYGRSVAKCMLPDGQDLSEAMVRQGMAIDWPKFSGGKYRHLEPADVRRKLWLADARQKGRMHVWKKFDEGHYRKTSK